MKLIAENEAYKIFNGSMLDMLENIEENSIDSIVCDPPYELGFMNKSWDSTGIAFRPETWEKCLKVLKPGGYLLAFGGSRTFHRIACAIEDAGFEIRDTIMWLYGSGFPKSLNIGLAIDKKNGVESKVVSSGKSGKSSRAFQSEETTTAGEYEIKQSQNEWQGWGTALKPAFEPIIMARKPFKGSVTENVLQYGVGGINIDECRIDYNGEVPNVGGRANYTRGDGYGFKALKEDIQANNLGRFPANVIHDGSEEVISGFPDTSPTKPHDGDEQPLDTKNMGWGFKRMPSTIEDNGGSASRYFYCAKASEKDRNEGLEIVSSNRVETPIKNIHPTVKPVELMQYLVRLVSPKGSTILDCFMGSGSTGKAVMFENRERQAGYKFIGIDLTEEYCHIANARIDYALNKYEYDWEQEIKQAEEKGQISLF